MGFFDTPNEQGKKDGEKGEKNIIRYELDEEYKKGYDYGKGIKDGSEDQEDLFDRMARSLSESEEYNKGHDRGEKLCQKDNLVEVDGDGCSTGCAYLIWVLLFIPFYGLFGACGLIGKKRTAALGMILISIFTALVIWASAAYTYKSGTADTISGILLVYMLIILPVTIFLLKKFFTKKNEKGK